MSVLFMRSATTAATPETKPRVWYQALFKYYDPQDRRFTQAEAAELIAANWHRTWKDIKRDGVTS